MRVDDHVGHVGVTHPYTLTELSQTRYMPRTFCALADGLKGLLRIMSQSNEPIVSINEVTKDYYLGKVVVPALRGISLQVHPGEFISIAGPSGSGKTTLLNLIGCVDTATGGVV